MIDVSGAAQEIERLQIGPVRLAPVGHHPKVGDHVFAIGHPGGGGEGLLTRTLSDGIVSAVGRKEQDALYLQVTVPLNPGNSGGPLFDDEGRVVGVNSFIVRKASGRDFALEALNFALEGAFVHEVLADPGKSLEAGAIAAVLNPPQDEGPQALAEALAAKAQRFLDAGYGLTGGSVRTSSRVFRLEAGKQRVFTLRSQNQAVYALAAVSQGTEAIELAVLDGEGRVVSSDVRRRPDPELAFSADEAGVYSLVVVNPSEDDAVVVTTLFKK